MAERITFDGTVLRGTTLEFFPDDPQQQVRHVKYWGIRGVAELRGQAGGRDIHIRFLVHDEHSSYDDLASVLEIWERRCAAQRHGTLQIRNDDNGVTRSFRKCTLLGFRELTGEGMGPLLDVAGTLDPDDQTPGWFQQVVLRFHQLDAGA